MRKNKNLLSSYLVYTEQSEAPTRFHIWSLISVIAACVRRQVWLDMGFFKVYPNNYIVLVGPPASRKTVAINIAIGLIQDNTDITMGADSTTREAIIKDLKAAHRVVSQIDGNPYNHTSLTIVSKELSVLLGKENHALLSFLTDLYDNPAKWNYHTKNSGIDDLRNCWLNMLAATTADWLSGSIPLSAIGGGFTSRIVFVVEEGPRHRTPRPKLTEVEINLREDLINDLEHISTLCGEMRLDDEGGEWFDEWYSTKKEKLESDTRFSGYAERKHIHVLKTAMALSISERDDLIIRKEDLVSAHNLIEELEDRMVEAFGSTGRSEVAMDVGDIMSVLKTVKKISKRELLRGLWRDVSPAKFDSAMKQLEEMGYVKSFLSNHTEPSLIMYELIKTD